MEILEDIFKCYRETKWLKNCVKALKPDHYKRNVDDFFVLFDKTEQVLPLNKNKNNFSFETEKELLFFSQCENL